MADLFAGLLMSREYVEQGAATLVEYARRLGHHDARSIVQARLGQAIRTCPELAVRLRSRAISIENAETIASAVADPATRDVEDWLDLAENCQLNALRGVVKLRREEAKRVGEDLRAVPLLLTDEEVEKIKRVRKIASQRAKRHLTDSQGVVVALDEYLQRHDPEQKAKRARSGGTDTRSTDDVVDEALSRRGPRLRYVPKAVEHRVRERAGHRCEVPGCTCTTGLELCHRRSWSRGGAHHPCNIVLLCHRHHVLFDAGRIACLGFSDCGRPIFRMPDGTVLIPKPRQEPEPTGPPE